MFRFGAGPAGAATIAEFIQYSSEVLHTADLANNRLGDVGVKELCTVLATSDVTTLNLAQNKVGVEGAKALGTVFESPQCKLVSGICTSVDSFAFSNLSNCQFQLYTVLLADCTAGSHSVESLIDLNSVGDCRRV